MTVDDLTDFLVSNGLLIMIVVLLLIVVVPVWAIISTIRFIRLTEKLSSGFDPYPAPISSRIRARLIDGILIYSLCTILFQLDIQPVAYIREILPQLMRPLAVAIQGDPQTSTPLVMAALAAWSATSIAYHVAFEAILGRTPGKALMFVRVLRDSLPPKQPALSQSIARHAMIPVDYIGLGALGLASMLSDSYKRRLGDRVANTVVLRVPYGWKASPNYETNGEPTYDPPNEHPDNHSNSATFLQPSPQESPWRTEAFEEARISAGREGERALREEVESLAYSGWMAYFGLEHRHFGDVDCLLIGPGGVFVVDAKSHRGIVTAENDGHKLLRDGEPFEKDFRRSMSKQFGHISRTLFGQKKNAPIQSLICFTRATLIPDQNERYPKRCCELPELSSIVLSSQTSISNEEISRLANLVEENYPYDEMMSTEDYSSKDWRAWR